jgi:stearoyl-CoA desaturase (delta-9 desaturase)
MKARKYTGTFFAYWGLHVAAIVALFLVPFSWHNIRVFLLSYFFGMFFITAGYHRYFSHRSYKLARIPQFLMAFMAQASAQKGILWWAANHRDHHIHSDMEEDIHSPVQKGFWYSHMGWIFDPSTQGYNRKKIADFGKYPELRFLDKYHWIPTVVVGGLFLAIGGVNAFLYGYVLAIICLYQASYCVNSLAHVYGSRRFETTDHSRNNVWLAIITLGEGWHNNHHHCKSSCRQGYKWWEIDMTFYLLTILSWVGIVKDIRPFRAENTKGVMVEASAVATAPRKIRVPKSEAA